MVVRSGIADARATMVAMWRSLCGVDGKEEWRRQVEEKEGAKKADASFDTPEK